MRIGIDARFLTNPQAGGFKTYTENVVYALSQVDRKNDYILYTDGEWSGAEFLSPNFTVRVVPGFGPMREQMKLPAVMSRDMIDVAHYLCNTAPVSKKSAMVMTIHDVIPCLSAQKQQKNNSLKFRAMAKYWRDVIPRAVRMADHVITISQSSATDIHKVLNVPMDKITVIPNGLNTGFRMISDLSRIESVRKKYKLPKRFMLGFASSDPRKNLIRLIEAAAIVEKRVPDVGLVLICTSEDGRDMATDTTARYDVRVPRLTLLDPLPNEDLVAIYNAADVLAFPSLYEGFGLPVIEAMACGTPVVTSNVASLPEVAGNAALLVDPTDIDGLAGTLTAVLCEEELSRILTERGIARASEFTWERTAAATADVYAQVCHSATVKGSRV